MRESGAPELQYQLRLRLYCGRSAAGKVACEASVQVSFECIGPIQRGKVKFIAYACDLRSEVPERGRLVAERGPDPIVRAQRGEQLETPFDRVVGAICGPRRDRVDAWGNGSRMSFPSKPCLQCCPQVRCMSPTGKNDFDAAQVGGWVISECLPHVQHRVRNCGPKAHVGDDGGFSERLRQIRRTKTTNGPRIVGLRLPFFARSVSIALNRLLPNALLKNFSAQQPSRLVLCSHRPHSWAAIPSEDPS
jgi:hypothetical protein